MTEHHFFVEPGQLSGAVVELTGDEAHHAARVLRVRRGEPITVADGTGCVAEAVVSRVGSTVEAEVRSVRTVPPPRPAITLYQAVTKGDKMDAVIEKAVEIGVLRIVPFLAERTIVRWDGSKSQRAADRWSAIARGAAKQSRSPWLTNVENVISSTGALAPREALVIALHESSSRRLRDLLPDDAPEAIGLVVGPEGGFDGGELRDLGPRGIDVAGLGERILRTETAGLVAATIVGYAYGSLG
ncbi:MAG: RsmE family RNA methyltransferase [Actinomycetota bacterium]